MQENEICGEDSDFEIDKVAEFFYEKTVLITGAAGSIGSELSKKLSNLNLKKLVLVDNNESELFMLNLGLKDKTNVVPVLADIRDSKKISSVFKEHIPEIVFHAAAYKHIPFMEEFPAEAIKNNIAGTFNILRSCSDNKISKFVLISSDKAVNPTSIMGATKRICERIVKCFSIDGYICVRFGNVTRSRGSVIPIFEKQIENNIPITITHPEMERYFMTTNEACNLILEATILSENGEIFVLDMGKPVKIIDIARKMIKESCVKTEIKIVGIRPGEKLKEELFFKNERRTRNNKILITNNGVERNPDSFLSEVEKLIKDVNVDDNKEDLKKKIWDLLSK
ncbi:MAG: polysaccharide biosynthesis protein [Candidatus Altiarchaeota archaeon]|nr:polysaccharide biosynthesis protein [Candidatus Altiarchaeota archaeon]